MGREVPLLVALAVAATPLLARADDPTPAQCVAAFEDAQIAQKAQKLVLAREKALLCSRSPCPAKLVPECKALLPGLEAGLPTLVLELRAAGAQVTLDGAAVSADALANATPVAVDPGEHLLVVQVGERRVETKVVVKVGEKARRVVLDAPPAPALPPPPPPRPPPPSRVYLVAGVGLGAFAVAGFVSSGVMTALALDDRRALEDPGAGCKPFCTEEQLASVKGKLLFADVLLGTGLTLATASVGLLIADAARQWRTAVVPMLGPGLAGAALGGRF